VSLATPDDIVTGLKDWGLKVIEWPGWRLRGSGHPFHPVGQLWHHDAFSESFPDVAAAEFMAEKGRPDLRPPLCNDAVGEAGVVYLLAYGNANHAGWGEADVLERLREGLPPRGDARRDPDRDGVVGNPWLWGHECRNAGTGRDPWEQLDVMERLGAAMCDINGWPTGANAGHREWTARKPDPVGFDMTAFRGDIARILIERTTPTTEEVDMIIVTSTGKDAAGKTREPRTLSGSIFPVVDGSTLDRLVKAGVPKVEYDPDDYDQTLRWATRASGF
jgi:hypothetical protein